MNVLAHMAGVAAQCDLRQAKASRDSWRKLAKLLGGKLRLVRAQLYLAHSTIRTLNGVVQGYAREVEQLRQRVTELGGGES